MKDYKFVLIPILFYFANEGQLTSEQMLSIN